MPPGKRRGSGFPPVQQELGRGASIRNPQDGLSTFTVRFKRYLKLIPYQYPCRIEVRAVDSLDMSQSFATIENKEARPNLLKARKEVIRVLIADDHPIAPDGLNNLLSLQEDVKVAAQASAGSHRLASA